MKKTPIVAVVSAGLGHPDPQAMLREVVAMKCCPKAVQKTIIEVAGGEIIKVEREDDKDGKWNYEATVKTNGKEWGFEVDPIGNS